MSINVSVAKSPKRKEVNEVYDPSIDRLVNHAFNVSQRLRRSQSKRDQEDAKRLADAVLAVLASQTPNAEA
ncbi:hypothetical protein RFM26_03205 [Mesorhizobium sp. VK23B]|uniref:Uncharacterized protein n=1 Tax=Mesorhizobium dulcispinae TaxID=3072316 RepID=A0ABU4X8E7_9HYPH|nr:MULTISPECIES: hypothetical protein [unclassified Mesorhizobium]MDX8464688.1 hypothetical protein [Mesorhizobium sp. VK23B]MDX8471074.1 hypothetical protein [Mesorhizobium sp. VK23A]